MSRKRLSKKQLKRDRFVEQTFDWAHWVETHRTQVLAGLAAAVVLVAGFFVYRSMTRGAEEAAARDYIQARQSYFTGNYQLAISDLENFLNQHGGTSYADDARFFLADAYHRGGQTDQAISALHDFLDRHGDSPLADNARRLLAATYAQAGDYDRAAETYREAIEAAQYDDLEVQLRETLADVYRIAGRREMAAEQYRIILEKEPEGEIAVRARRALAETTVQPLARGSAPAGAGGAPGTADQTGSAEETVAAEDGTTGP